MNFFFHFLFTPLAAAGLLADGVFATPSSRASSSRAASPDADGKYWIFGEGISAAFIPYGASITNLVIRDKSGVQRDLIMGFDNVTAYHEDQAHPHLGGVPGRYANRIKNSTFALDGVQYHVTPNENPTSDNPSGLNTLHGGPDVVAYITYTMGNMTWDAKMIAIPTTKKTPIMLTSHTYWNLDGFANDQTNTVLNHTLHLPYSGQRVAVDSILIPTGDIEANTQDSVNDFWTAPKQIGASFADPELEGNCGFNCTGYDNCYIINRPSTSDWRTDAIATLSSPWSGITLNVFSDQEAFQVYSCNGQNGTFPLKSTQGTSQPSSSRRRSSSSIKNRQSSGDDAEGSNEALAFPRTVPQYGCIVLEVQDWIDGINHPEWGRMDRQVFGPGGDPYVLQVSHRFTVE
ncbi:hypothetical protein N0V88_000347 [Collariella sp. IMI 366227]|nr:hypothetical protein N0V88_000347 [Collariella sp. IMI 366227]